MQEILSGSKWNDSNSAEVWCFLQKIVLKFRLCSENYFKANTFSILKSRVFKAFIGFSRLIWRWNLHNIIDPTCMKISKLVELDKNIIDEPPHLRFFTDYIVHFDEYPFEPEPKFRSSSHPTNVSHSTFHDTLWTSHHIISMAIANEKSLCCSFVFA